MIMTPYWLKNIVKWKKQAHEAAYNMITFTWNVKMAKLQEQKKTKDCLGSGIEARLSEGQKELGWGAGGQAGR